MPQSRISSWLLNPSHGFCGLACFLAALTLAGCGSQDVPKLEDYLEELEFDRPLESVREIKVNSYRIPCAARHQDSAGRDVEPIWVQMKFDLYVIAAEDDEKAVLKGLERHKGMIDDTVISICRRTSIDQLQDNRWSTLKASLLDALRDLLGEQRVQQVALVYSSPWEPI